MFDYLRSSMDIGELTDQECQTKDIDDLIGGTMSFYWVDPVGALWYVDYSNTTDFVENEDENLPIWLRFKHVPNGNRGKVTRCYLTKRIGIYTSDISPDGHLDWIQCELLIVDGFVKDFRYINNCI